MWSRGDTQSPRLKAFLSFSDLFTHSTSQSSQPNIYRPSRCLVLLGVGTEKMKDPSSLSQGKSRVRGGSHCAVTTVWPCDSGCGLLGAEGGGTEQWGQRELQVPRVREGGRSVAGAWPERRGARSGWRGGGSPRELCVSHSDPGFPLSDVEAFGEVETEPTCRKKKIETLVTSCVTQQPFKWPPYPQNCRPPLHAPERFAA